eukprot:4548627-Alexandrium_andersonii.AAC.1
MGCNDSPLGGICSRFRHCLEVPQCPAVYAPIRAPAWENYATNGCTKERAGLQQHDSGNNSNVQFVGWASGRPW